MYIFSILVCTYRQEKMAQIGKLEARTEITSSAEKFYGFFKNHIKRLVQMFPQNVKSCDFLGGGDELRTSTVISWKYDVGKTIRLLLNLF